MAHGAAVEGEACELDLIRERKFLELRPRPKPTLVENRRFNLILNSPWLLPHVLEGPPSLVKSLSSRFSGNNSCTTSVFSFHFLEDKGRSQDVTTQIKKHFSCGCINFQLIPLGLFPGALKHNSTFPPHSNADDSPVSFLLWSASPQNPICERCCGEAQFKDYFWLFSLKLFLFCDRNL